MKLIQSRDNAYYKQLKRLAESGRERRKRGRTLLDGLHLAQAWEAQRGPLSELVVAESALGGGEVADWLAGRDCTVIGDALMRELGIVDTPSGLLAVVDTPQPAAAADPDGDAVLLDGVQDPGNLGSLLRSAAAAGVGQVLLAPGCAAAWSPKVLRAGQGAHFVLSIHEDRDLADFMTAYRGTTLATTLERATSLYAASWAGPLAWVFGAEGRGVSPALIERAGLRIHIPMPGAVESLNVGAAAAVCLFEMVRRRLA
ncbi:TrmH family RNA methyltransferase [Azonexus sp.]|uniref:TrmH family RNA methyltransferase n=1 Tax=Azonexus sp. TaxID=1872668 RepID=UPI0035B076DA